MSVVLRHKFVCGSIAVALLVVVSATIYANRILGELMPGYLGSLVPGKITFERVTGSLIHGIRIRGVRFYPIGTPAGAPPALTVDELRIGYDLFKSLMLRDRYVQISLLEPRLSVDVRTVLFDPAVLLELPRVLASRNVHINIAATGLAVSITGLKAEHPAMEDPLLFTGDANIGLGPDGIYTYTLPLSSSYATGQIRGNLVAATRRGKASVLFNSRFLVDHPLNGSGYVFTTPMEGRANVDLAVLEKNAPLTPGAYRMPFGPHLVMDSVIAGSVAGMAGVLTNVSKGLRVVGITSDGSFSKSGFKLLSGSIPVTAGRLLPAGELPDWDMSRWNLVLTGSAVPVPDFEKLLPFPMTGHATGTVTLAPKVPVLLDLSCTETSSEYFSFDRATLKASLDQDKIVFNELEAWSAGGSGVSTGTFDLAPQHFAFHARFRSFPQTSFKSLLDGVNVQDGLFTGTLTGAGHYRPYISEAWTFNFVMQDPTIAGYHANSGTMIGQYMGRDLKVSRLDMARKEYWDDARFQVDSSPSSGLRARGILRGLKLDRVTSGMTGRVDCGLALGIVDGRLVEMVKGECRDFGAKGSTRKVPPLAFRITGAKGGGHELEVTDRTSFEIKARLGEISGRDVTLASVLRHKVSGSYRIRDLSPFARLFSVGDSQLVQDGHVDGNFEVGARDGSPVLETEIHHLVLKTSRGPLEAEDFDLELDQHHVRISPVDARLGAGHVILSGDIGVSGDVSLSAEAKDVLMSLPTQDAAKQAGGAITANRLAGDVTGHLSGTATFRGNLQSPSIEADVRLNDFEAPGNGSDPVTGAFSGHVSYRDGRARLSHGQFRSGDAECTVVGQLPATVNLKTGVAAVTDGPVDFQMNLPKSDGSVLALLIPGLVSRVNGTVKANLRMNGTTAEPRMNGSAELSAVNLRTPLLPDPVTDAHVFLLFNDHQVTIKQMDGKVFSGRFQASGTMPFGADGAMCAIKGTGTGMRYRTQSMDLTGLHANLELTGKLAAPVLSGTVRFDKGHVKIPLARSEPITGNRKSASRLTLNVRMDIPGNLWVRSSQLDSEMKGVLVLTGSPEFYKVGGELETVRGYLVFNGRQITITDGSIKFMQPQKQDFLSFNELVDPAASAREDRESDAAYVNMTGQVDVDTVKIYVLARGFAVDNGVKVSVRSVPELEESQVIAVLMTGRQVYSDLGSRDVPGLITNSVSNQVSHTLVDRQLETALQKTFGLDDFRINSGLLNVGTHDPTVHRQVSVGKYIAPNLYLAADGSLDSSTPFFQRLELDLKLDRTVAVTLERALANGTVTGTLFDRLDTTSVSSITANETRLGISKELRW